MHDFTIFLNGIVNIMPSFNCVFHIFFYYSRKTFCNWIAANRDHGLMPNCVSQQTCMCYIVERHPHNITLSHKSCSARLHHDRPPFCALTTILPRFVQRHQSRICGVSRCNGFLVCRSTIYQIQQIYYVYA